MPAPVLRAKAAPAGSVPASQTLVRGLDLLEIIARGPVALPALASRLGLARSTTHRLATALLERRYLAMAQPRFYALGPKLLELGARAREQTDLLRLAHPYLEALAAETQDAAYLAIAEGGAAVVMDQVTGRRRVIPHLIVGERMALSQTPAGCALLLDAPERAWRDAFAQDCGSAASEAAFLDRMRLYAECGHAFDTEAADHMIGVAAPVRGQGGAIVAALGLAVAAPHMTAARRGEIGRALNETAAALGADLGAAAATPCHPRDIADGDRGIAARSSGKTGRPTITLEAEAPCVHDPLTNGCGRSETAEGRAP